MKYLICLLGIIVPLLCSAQVLQNVNGTTTVGGQVPASAFPGTPWTNGMTFAATASNSSVTFVDGANAQMVVSNGVIGTVKAITNSGNVHTATISSSGNVNLGTTATAVNLGPPGGSATVQIYSGANSAFIGDIGAAGNGTVLTVNDSVGLVSANVNGFSGAGGNLTGLNAANISSGILNQNRFSLTNFTSYAAGTAYTYTGTAAQLTFGTTSPGVTINQAGTYLIQGHVGIKYSAATYAGAQSVTNKFRRTNNTAADLTNGGRVTELPVLTTFTGGDVIGMPPVIYTATSGDIIQIFGAVTATPSAGSILADSAEIICLRIY